MKLPKNLGKTIGNAKSTLRGAGKAAMAGAAGAALVVGNVASALQSKASKVSDMVQRKSKKSEEGIVVKKSTFVAVLVALAAVAGVLGALYFYVLRREKELDEYEQLLFSEDFNEELPYDEEEDDAPLADAAKE